MNANPYQLSFFLLWFYFYLSHLHVDSEIYNTLKKIKSNVTVVTDFNQKYPDGLVYFYAQNISYFKYNDSFFNIPAYGGSISRHVEYCMFREVIFNDQSGDYDVNRRWVSIPVNSSLFEYQQSIANPPLNVIEKYETSQNVALGNFIINSSLFEKCGPKYYLGITPKIKSLFNISDAKLQYNFNYIGLGWFYYSAKNDSEIRRDTIKEELKKGSFQNLQNQSKKSAFMKKFFNKCYFGDIRVRFNLFSPINMTVFAYNKNGTLIPTIIEGKKIGNLYREKVPLKQIYKLVKDSMQDEHQTNELILISFTLSLFPLIINFSDVIENGSWRLFLFGSINMFIRGMFYRDIWYLNLYVWATIVILILFYGFAAGFIYLQRYWLTL